MQTKMSLENVNSAIAALEKIDPPDEYAYEKAFLAFKTIMALPTLIYEMSGDIEVFRSRTHFDNELYELKTDISLAPHSAIKYFARCNRPYQSKFYCSENRPTSYMELVSYWSTEREVGQNLYTTIGRWRIKRNFLTLIVTSPDPAKRISRFDQYHGAALDDILAKESGESKEAMVIFYQYLFDRFRKSAKNDQLTYLITCAYCNIALARTPYSVDAIYYPSVPFKGNGVNFAFNNRFITSENIELLSVHRDEFVVYLNDLNIKSFRQTNERDALSVVQGEADIVW
jgi:hypothetical protein